MSYRPLITSIHRHLFQQKAEQATRVPDALLPPEIQQKHLEQHLIIKRASISHPEKESGAVRPQSRKKQRYAPM